MNRFYAYYSIPLPPGMPDDWDHANCLVEFQVPSTAADRTRPQGTRILLEVYIVMLNAEDAKWTC